MARERSDITRRDERGMTRPDRPEFISPFRVFDRFAQEMDRVFGWPIRSSSASEWNWRPDVEVFHRGSELVLRADLPGLKKEDIKIEVTEDHITLEGERKHEYEETREGMYRSERSYGTFRR